MKRLTRRLADGRACFKPHLYGKMNKDVCDRLAAIEDILGDDYDLDRLRELAQADKEGRCMVLDGKSKEKELIRKLMRLLYWLEDCIKKKGFFSVQNCGGSAGK